MSTTMVLPDKEDIDSDELYSFIWEHELQHAIALAAYGEALVFELERRLESLEEEISPVASREPGKVVPVTPRQIDAFETKYYRPLVDEFRRFGDTQDFELHRRSYSTQHSWGGARLGLGKYTYSIYPTTEWLAWVSERTFALNERLLKLKTEQDDPYRATWNSFTVRRVSYIARVFKEHVLGRILEYEVLEHR